MYNPSLFNIETSSSRQLLWKRYYDLILCSFSAPPTLLLSVENKQAGVPNS